MCHAAAPPIEKPRTAMRFSSMRYFFCMSAMASNKSTSPAILFALQ